MPRSDWSAAVGMIQGPDNHFLRRAGLDLYRLVTTVEGGIRSSFTRLLLQTLFQKDAGIIHPLPIMESCTYLVVTTEIST